MTRHPRRFLCYFALIIFLLTVNAATGAAATAAEDPTPTPDYSRMIYLDAQGGVTSAVAISADGGWAFTNSGTILHAVDLTTTPADQWTSYNSPPLGGIIRDIVLQGNYAYLAADSGGLVIVDVSNPAQMRAVGRYDTGSNGIAWDVAVAGSRAYLVDQLNGLFILDVQNPAQPQLVFAHDPSDGIQHGIVVEGSYAYTFMDWMGLYVYDLNHLDDEENWPRLISNGTLGMGAANSMTYAGGYLYIGGSGVLTVVDPTNPDAPVVARLKKETGEPFLDLAVSQENLYFAGGEKGPCVVPLAELEAVSPTIACSMRITGVVFPANRIALYGGRMYTAYDDALSAHSLPMAAGSEPAVVKAFPLARINDVFADGGLLYAATDSGLVIYDPLNPAALRNFSSLPIPMNQVEVVYTGSPQQRRYVIVSGSGSSDRNIHVIDATNLDALSEVIVQVPGDPSKYLLPKTLLDSRAGSFTLLPALLKQSGTRLYVATMLPNRLYILDLSTLPNSLAELTPANLPLLLTDAGRAQSISLYTWSNPKDPIGTFHEKLYVAMQQGGIKILDVSDLASITESVLTLPKPPGYSEPLWAQGVAVAGVRYEPQVIYASTWGKGIQIYDTLTATWSQLTTRGYYVQDLWLQGSYLFAAEREIDPGMSYYDVSDPQNPRLAGYGRIPGENYHFEPADYPRLHAFSNAGLQTLIVADHAVFAPAVIR